MKVLMLSQDVKIFDEGSDAAIRMASYAVIADELEILVFGAGERKEKKLAPNVRAMSPGGVNKFDAFIRGIRELSECVHKNRPDVVSSQDPFFLGCAGLLVARRNGIPFQAQLHTDCFSYAYASQSLRQMIEVVLAFFVIQSSSCVRVVSSRIAHSVTSFSKVPITTLPIRVQKIPTTLFPKPGEFLNRFTILSVARLTREKQLHIVIDALRELPEINLIIVGDGPLRKHLELRAHRLGLESRVTFAGWQNPHPYYAHADVFVSMSRFEGYGIALMEAALHRLPIISTDAGVVGEVLRDKIDALIVSGNANALKKALRKLLSDSNARSSLGASACKTAEGTLVSESEYLTRYKQALSTCGSKRAS